MTEATPVEKEKAKGAAGSSLPSLPDHLPPGLSAPAVPPPPPPARPERPEVFRTPTAKEPGYPPPSESQPPWRRPSSDVPSSSAANPLASMEAALGELDPVVSLAVCLERGGRIKSINLEPKDY